MRNFNDETTWEQMLKERDELEQENVHLKTDIILYKEQLRVADVAYNYWTKRCRELEEANERANKLIEDEANKRAQIAAEIQRNHKEREAHMKKLMDKEVPI